MPTQKKKNNFMPKWSDTIQPQKGLYETTRVAKK